MWLAAVLPTQYNRHAKCCCSRMLQELPATGNLNTAWTLMSEEWSLWSSVVMNLEICVCLMTWGLSMTFGVMYGHTLFLVCKLPNQTSGLKWNEQPAWWLQTVTLIFFEDLCSTIHRLSCFFLLHQFGPGRPGWLCMVSFYVPDKSSGSMVC